ncbi:hypothetical protein [Draconibacterium halophilum]|uniref:Uncharacterized protein n=1 Tax=Draconibacterium halophilum TaxID=2706887 RepID=A0A6C0RFL0_9BACT|nr:hypothetical protein [Draconibacterium halophilum]QIA08313.1 hypothetical protein G0Q07_11570 [Draconibacterium halophilum]
MRQACIFILLSILTSYFSWANQQHNEKRFNTEKDLLVMQFDCKTDVDDIHSAAALKTLLSNHEFDAVNYFAVAGTYGIQEGLYVPPNKLFQQAFDERWSDAHANREKAVEEMKNVTLECLQKGGSVWIAEAGQSDFSAELIKAIQKETPDINTAERIHIVQHSDWNEDVTSAKSLAFVKAHSNYHKIPDGNAEGNGTPGFRTPGYSAWKTKVQDPELIKLWRLAVEIGLKYNGKDGRYNNEAIASGGLDFSDLSEVCWILGIQSIKDTDEFFNAFGQ